MLTTATQQTVRNHSDVSEFACDSKTTAQHMRVGDHCSTNACANGKHDHVLVTAAGTVLVFCPTGSVGIVFDDYRNAQLGF